MSSIDDLLNAGARVANIGLELFATELERAQATVVNVDWRPPAGGDERLGRILAALEMHADRIDQANREAVARMVDAQPVWVDVRPAGEVIPGFTPTTVLHSGPPVAWQQMSGTQRGGVIAALIFEGFAANAEEAEAVAASGQIRLAPCHHFGAVGPMAGVLSASMPVIVVENRTAGNRAYSFFNGEGKNSSHTMGHYGPPAQEMLRWLRDVLGPAMQRAVRRSGGIDLKAITARAVQMGDECHNRLVASTSLLVRTLMPHLARTAQDSAELADIGDFLVRNDWFYLNFSMAACKSAADAASGVPWSTLVTAMARNGFESGIRISGLGESWFTAPAPMVKGLYFPGYSAADADPDIGDSAITETCGLGACTMAGAPSITQLVGGTVDDALRYTAEMGEITLTTNPHYTIPHLNFQGTPTGIDLRKVLETGITPVIDTAITHRIPDRGMIGAGLVRVPMECFKKALIAFAERYEIGASASQAG